MTVPELLVVVGGVALIALLTWYFFAPRKAATAQVEGGQQHVDTTVRGGYSPNLVRVGARHPDAADEVPSTGEQRLHRSGGVPGHA